MSKTLPIARLRVQDLQTHRTVSWELQIETHVSYIQPCRAMFRYPMDNVEILLVADLLVAHSSLFEIKTHLGKKGWTSTWEHRADWKESDPMTGACFGWVVDPRFHEVSPKRKCNDATVDGIFNLWVRKTKHNLSGILFFNLGSWCSTWEVDVQPGKLMFNLGSWCSTWEVDGTCEIFSLERFGCSFHRDYPPQQKSLEAQAFLEEGGMIYLDDP